MTMLQAGGMTPEWIAIIQGRIISDSRSAYTRPTESQLIYAYERSYQHLSVLPKSESMEIQVLKVENAQLREGLESVKANQLTGKYIENRVYEILKNLEGLGAIEVKKDQIYLLDQQLKQADFIVEKRIKNKESK